MYFTPKRKAIYIWFSLDHLYPKSPRRLDNEVVRDTRIRPHALMLLRHDNRGRDPNGERQTRGPAAVGGPNEERARGLPSQNVEGQIPEKKA